MSTIDNLNKNIHENYLERIKNAEYVEKQYGVESASKVSVVSVLKSTATVSALDELLGFSFSEQSSPWAMFTPPKGFKNASVSTLMMDMVAKWKELAEKKQKKGNSNDSGEDEHKGSGADGKSEENHEDAEENHEDAMCSLLDGDEKNDEDDSNNCVALIKKLSRQLRFIKMRILQFLKC